MIELGVRPADTKPCAQPAHDPSRVAFQCRLLLLVIVVVSRALHSLGHEAGLPGMASPSPSFGASTSATSTPTAPHHVHHHSSPNTTWFFPGPSSRYHHRERSQTYQNPCPKSPYTPHGPVLSTEKRASHHRRAASSVNVLSPPGSESGRSPLGRFHSYTPHTSKAATEMNTRTPTTPARSPEARRSNSLQASPFSDYFTDDERGRELGRIAYPAAKPDTRHIILRMQKLEAQLSREDKGADIFNVVSKKMSEIEDEVQILQLQSDPSLDVQDSELFMDDDGASQQASEENDCRGDDRGHVDEAVEQPAEPHEAEQDTQPADVQGEEEEQERILAERQAEHDFAILEAQRILANVSKVQEQLRQRYAEFRELNYSSTVAIEEREQELEGLRSENERLRSDIGFDHSELLFLKLQFKALEVEVADLEGSKRISEMKRSRILREMKSWRTDWQAVEKKFKRRLSSYSVLSTEDSKDLRSDSPVQHLAYDEEDDWHLESVKKDVQGKVQSITIRRLPSLGQFPADQLSESIYLTHSIGHTKEEVQGAPVKIVRAAPPALPRRPTRERSTQTPPSSSSSSSTGQQQPESNSSLSTPAVNPDEPTKPQSQERSAWQDLWTGLSNLAGFAEDEDDES
nr:hypothetical protein CFP56_56468 [Quercus suber]